MSKLQPVVFYDILAKDGVGCWSPNTWKTRCVLQWNEAYLRSC